MNKEEFIKEVEKLGISIDDKILKCLNTYYEMLIDYNTHTNLTRITDEEDVYLKHFYDSLTLIKAYDLNIAQYIAKYAVSMGGVDVIAFTAGVGENQTNRRREICKKLEFLGVKLDESRNEVRGEEKEISSDDSLIKVYVIPTNEELVIARDTKELISK